MDSYLIGALVIEMFFWLTQSTREYFSMMSVRALIYGVALLLFYPVAARFARERKAHNADAGLAAGVPTPKDALAVLLPENITVYYRPAPLAKRVYAMTIDALIVCALGGIWFFIMAIGSDVLRARAVSQLGLEIGLIIVPLAYFVLQEATGDGQTLGKRQAGIRAIHESGRALSYSEVFARNILRPLMLVPPFNLLEAFSIRTNGWRQRLGDLAAGSVVIIDPK